MAAKTTTWFGTVDGDWTVAGNWDNGQPSTVADKDTVIYSKDAVNAMTTNLDRTVDNGTVGQNLALFYVEEGAKLPIGSTGSPLILAADKIVNRGTGQFNFLSKDGSAGSLTTANVIIDTDRTDSDAMILDDANGATVDRLEVFKGRVNLKSTMTTVNTAVFSYRTSPLTDVIANIEAAGSALFTTFYMNGGRVTNARSVGELRIGGGTLKQGAQVSRYSVFGGTVIHTDNANIATMALFGGVMDLRGVKGPLLITDLYMASGARLLYNKDIVTITNDWTDYKGE